MQASMLAWVVTYLLHSTLLVLGAWLLERRWGDRPERMSAVWKTALVGGLLTATVQTGLGVAPLAGRWELVGAHAEVGSPSWPPPDVAAPVMAEPRADALVVVESPAPSWPPPDAVGDATPAGAGEAVVAAVRVGEREPMAVDALPIVEREPALATAPVGEAAPTFASVPASMPSSPGWLAVVPWVMALLGLGALLGLASVVVAFAALRRQLEGRRSLAEGTLPTLLEGLRRRAGIERPVSLTVAPRVQVPMAVGVLRPEIVVPYKAAQELPPAHQESLLAHELAHVLRRDPTWRLVGLLVERVCFFQPLNRLASRRVAQAAEYLCDDWAARHTRQPLALASCLTEIATWVARIGPVAATMAGPRSILGRRVQRLLQPARACARPWWLSAAVGLPLVAVVAVAPGVGTSAHAKGDRKAPERIVVIDEEGRRHEVRPRSGGAIVVQERDGELVVRSVTAAEPELAVEDDGASRRVARKAAREQERAKDAARRDARKALRRAFRTAEARGDAAPSRAEVEAILRRARTADGPRSHPEHVELHVVVPGELELHGHVPVDIEAIEQGIAEGLEGLEGLEGVEGLRVLEGLEGLEELGPVLEQIERELEAEGLDVVMLRRPGAAQEHAQIARERARVDRERARVDRERVRVHRDATGEARREVEREAARLEREAEALRRHIERIQQQGRMRERAAEPPTVWVPAPQASRFAGPAPAPMPPMRRLRGPTPKAPHPPAAPMAPKAPTAPQPPTAPAAPQPSVGPVVWVSWPPPTSGAFVSRC